MTVCPFAKYATPSSNTPSTWASTWGQTPHRHLAPQDADAAEQLVRADRPHRLRDLDDGMEVVAHHRVGLERDAAAVSLT